MPCLALVVTCESCRCDTYHVSSEPITESSVQLTLRAKWGDGYDVPVVPANQFIAAVGLPSSSAEPDGINLIFGYLAPPLLLGTPDEIRETAQGIKELPVEIKGRFLLTRGRLDELIKVLQSAADQYDQMKGAGRNE